MRWKTVGSRGALLAILSFAIVWSGCFDVEETLTLERDLSGRAGFAMGIDFEPMILLMAQFKRGFEGKEGPPSAAELAEAQRDFLDKKSDDKTKLDTQSLKADMKKELPKGIELLDAGVEDNGLRLKVHFLVGFDKLEKLTALKVPDKKKSDAPADGPSGPSNPFDSPFGDLSMVDEGKTLLLTTKPKNVIEETQKEAPPNLEGDDKAMFDRMFKNLRFYYRIEAPFEVVEHNATRVEGKALIWEFTAKDFEKLMKEEREAAEAEKAGKTAKPRTVKKPTELNVRVRYKK